MEPNVGVLFELEALLRSLAAHEEAGLQDAGWRDRKRLIGRAEAFRQAAVLVAEANGQRGFSS